MLDFGRRGATGWRWRQPVEMVKQLLQLFPQATPAVRVQPQSVRGRAAHLGIENVQTAQDMGCTERGKHGSQAVIQCQPVGRTPAGGDRQNDFAVQRTPGQQVEKSLENPAISRLINRGSDHDASRLLHQRDGLLQRRTVEAGMQEIGRGEIANADQAHGESPVAEFMHSVIEQATRLRIFSWTTGYGDDGHDGVLLGHKGFRAALQRSNVVLPEARPPLQNANPPFHPIATAPIVRMAGTALSVIRVK